MFGSVTLLILSLLSTRVLGNPMTGEAKSPIPGYKLVDLQWEVEVFPGKHVNLTGTIDHVRHQVIQLNPRWEETMASQSSNQDDVGSLDKRGLRWRNVVCGRGPNKFEWASVSTVRDKMIPKLRGWKGLPTMPDGTCGAIMCLNGNNIFLCNDDSSWLKLRGYADIADAAQMVLNSFTVLGAVVGQQFVEPNWNVIVTSSWWGDRCWG